MVGTGIDFDCIINWNLRMQISFNPPEINFYTTIYATDTERMNCLNLMFSSGVIGNY
jgi:hypothetical protein